ncbi:MAG: TrkH family potassium uptake protein [Sandaracinaceae bacterium]|nr:TrkH family potassium uptake protein [Sandaracinaceae bacterium]
MRDARRQLTRSKWRDFRGVLRPTGVVVTGLAVALALTALAAGAIEFASPESRRRPLHVIALLGIAVAGGAVGVAMARYGKRFSGPNLSRREALLSVALIWVFAGVLGGAPFVVAAGMSPADAFFETISGFTTTGATVITHIERDLSTSLLLWRSVIQWLGGMGIVVLFVAVFPNVGAGAKHMFKGEVPGATGEGLQPRIAQTSFTLWKLYAAFTALQAILLVVCGLSPFEAVCHAMTTMSTGGFSTRDASIAAFESPAAEYVISVFMLIGSLNFALYYAVLKHRSFRPLWRSTELRAFLLMVGVATIASTLGIASLHGRDAESSFRHALFQVGTFVSSTGYVTEDYMRYPPSILAVLIGLMFVGGCSGSTAGGLKMERLVLMAKMSWLELRRSFRPAVVQTVRMNKAAVAPDILSDVAVFVGVYVAVLAGGTLALCVTDSVPVPTAFGATLTCLANSGPAPFYQGADNFASYSDTAKIVFSLTMLLGRLELFTLFALLVPDFWRR